MTRQCPQTTTVTDWKEKAIASFVKWNKTNKQKINTQQEIFQKKSCFFQVMRMYFYVSAQKMTLRACWKHLTRWAYFSFSPPSPLPTPRFLVKERKNTILACHYCITSLMDCLASRSTIVQAHIIYRYFQSRKKGTRKIDSASQPRLRCETPRFQLYIFQCLLFWWPMIT